MNIGAGDPTRPIPPSLDVLDNYIIIHFIIFTFIYCSFFMILFFDDLFPDTRFRSTAIRSVLTEPVLFWPLLVEGHNNPNNPEFPESPKTRISPPSATPPKPPPRAHSKRRIFRCNFAIPRATPFFAHFSPPKMPFLPRFLPSSCHVMP